MLAEVFAAIAERLPAGTTCEMTAAAVDYNQAPPRVVFVPTGETFVGPERAGTSLLTRMAGVQAHIWGAGNTPAEAQTATEVLLNHLVAAIHTCALGSYGLNSGRWYGGHDGEHGFVYVLDWFLKIPLTREPVATVPIQSMPIAKQIRTELP
jgi:hypothetical protein